MLSLACVCVLKKDVCFVVCVFFFKAGLGLGAFGRQQYLVRI